MVERSPFWRWDDFVVGLLFVSVVAGIAFGVM